MYFWNTKKLIEDLKNDRLSEQNYKNYYLISSVFMFIIMFAMRLSPIVDVVQNTIDALLNIIIFIIGVNFCFKANGGNQGKQFLSRLICLCLPIGIRFILAYFLLILCIIFAFIVTARFIDSTQIPALIAPYQKWVMLIISIFMQVMMYWRFCVALKAISRIDN
ncbi:MULTISPECIES: hypothetical protein [Acinetobacter]|uniref:Uncharacterized protein n=1 Tax=Acinetobacter dispersus TaxID=70348 RepID=N9MMK2_9GAMM|nr:MULTISPECIES: hypothetical protein [Acinetobacter]ENW91946.1 hypothetical protein F904_01884 [Acinetobacter dispersus]MCH7304618.1 hypothetical protein [Acinetobacter higginsii]